MVFHSLQRNVTLKIESLQSIFCIGRLMLNISFSDYPRPTTIHCFFASRLNKLFGSSSKTFFSFCVCLWSFVCSMNFWCGYENSIACRTFCLQENILIVQEFSSYWNTLLISEILDLYILNIWFIEYVLWYFHLRSTYKYHISMK